MSKCSAEEIAEKKRIALEKLRRKELQLPPANSVDTIKMGGCTAKTPLSSVPGNKASTFLSALKQSTTLTLRKEARDSTHPYKRTAQNQDKTKLPMLGLSPPKQLAPVFHKTVTCKVYVISAARFAVQPSAYHVQMIQVFKSIPSKGYNNDTRIWSFALQDYNLFQQRLEALKPDVVCGSIPKKVINLCLEPEKVVNRSCLDSIEPTLSNKLLPFQQEGVCYAIARNGRIMICDEMGLGKTYQALAIADFYKDDWPLLICTTASTRESWSSHIVQLLSSIPVHYVQMLSNNNQYIGDAKVVITSYSMMERHVTRLMELKFGFIIFDESHTLKNNKAKCTVVALSLASQAKHTVLLSGTPALSRPLELFTQLQIIDKKFMNYIDFTTRYCDGKQNHFGWDATGQSNLEELNVLLKLKFMIRRIKTDVLPELAEKMRETVLLDPSLVWTNDETKETLDKLASNLTACKGREKEEILLKFYAQTAMVKARAVCAYLKKLVQDKVKFIVFAHHRVMLDAICDCLFKLKVNFVRIDGSTRNETRAEYIALFQKKSSCQVAVLSLKACNSGITLTAAEMIVFAELDWNPSTLAQAESRAHRIGQHKAVICRYLMASKTADDVIWHMLKAKQDILNRAGLFCDNLQEATHTAAPTTSNNITQYFLPARATVKDSTNVLPLEDNCNSEKTESPKSSSKENTINCTISKELENIDTFFEDDDAFSEFVF